MAVIKMFKSTCVDLIITKQVKSHFYVVIRRRVDGATNNQPGPTWKAEVDFWGRLPGLVLRRGEWGKTDIRGMTDTPLFKESIDPSNTSYIRYVSPL